MIMLNAKQKNFFELLIAEKGSNTQLNRLMLLLLLLIIIMLIIPSFAYANGLFDFQMKMAKRGSAEAQFKVGEMYETGFGIKQNKQKGIKWIKEAAKNGHETAGFKLLYWDLEKNGITRANKTKFAALKAKAMAANPQAMYYMGKMYAHGAGVKTNYVKSLRWLNKAALVGIQSAEQEMDTVREKQQLRLTVKRRAYEKKRAQLKASQDAERQKQKAKRQKQLQLKKQQQTRARAKAQIEALYKNQQIKKAAAASLQKQKASTAAATAKQKAEQRQLEEKKQALLRKRAIKQQHKEKFESDPCSSRSARFLSTCR